MSAADIFKILVTTIWSMVFVLATCSAYFLYKNVGYARIFKEPGEKGRWTGPVAASICGIAGFIFCLIYLY